MEQSHLSVPSFSAVGLARSRSSFLIVVAVVLALVASVMVAPKVRAEEVAPVIGSVELKDSKDNLVQEIGIDGIYRLIFDFDVAGAKPGDHFTVALPSGFHAIGAEQDIDGFAETVRENERLVSVRFTDAIADFDEASLEFFYNVKFTGEGTSGEGKQDLAPEILIGGQSYGFVNTDLVYNPDRESMPINKFALANLGGADFTKLDVNLDGEVFTVEPARGQVFAQWYLQVNNWNVSGDAGEEFGGNVVVTDTLQSLGDFEPKLVQANIGADTRVLSDDELQDLLVGTYVDRRQGDQAFRLVVRKSSTERATFGVPADDPAISYSVTDQGAQQFEFRISDFLASQYETLSEARRAIVDDPNAQYSLSYVSVLPQQNGFIRNEAQVTSDMIEEPLTDAGAYRFRDVDGWNDGEYETQPTTDVTVETTWSGLAAGEVEPVVTYELLADGLPAADITGEDVPAITLNPGETSTTWVGLPTQVDKGTPIVYSVQQSEIDGFTTTYGPEYRVNLRAENATGTLTVTNTKIPTEEPTVTPTSETSTKESPVPTVTVTETEPTTVTATETSTKESPVPTVTVTETEPTTVTATETSTKEAPVPTTTVTSTETSTVTPPVVTTSVTVTKEAPPSTSVTQPTSTSTTKSVSPKPDNDGSSSKSALHLLWLIPVALLAGGAAFFTTPAGRDLLENWMKLATRVGMMPR